MASEWQELTESHLLMFKHVKPSPINPALHPQFKSPLPLVQDALELICIHR